MAAIAGGRETFLRLRELLYADFQFDAFLSMHISRESRFFEIFQKLMEGAFQDALEELESDADPSNGTDPTYWLLLARARQGLGEEDEAVECAKQVLLLPLESRFMIQTWSILRGLGYMPRGAEGAEVLGVIVEVGRPDGEAIVAGFADGEARMFMSSGGGMIGEPTDTDVAAAAKNMVAVAAPYVDDVEVMKGNIPVAKGQAKFAIITTSGTRTHEEGLEDVAKPENSFHPLFNAMNTLLTCLRIKYLEAARRQNGPAKP